VKLAIEVASPIVRSARVLQAEGIFDIPPAEKTHLRWDVELPIEARPWNVGLIVGPSGCGKSTIARRLWPEEVAHTFAWDPARSVLDAFPSSMGIKDIIALMSSVGFSSPPSWQRPFGVLSNGEQFRVTMARLLAECPELAVVDEFTSVVDRTVAQVGSAALAKAVRRRGGRFVAVTCHEDVEAWLQPDWVYRPAERAFTWREVQRRPPIDLVINRVHHSAWQLFKHHHYLTADIHRAATCFVAFWRGRPVAFDAWLPFVGRLKDERRARRGHRTVCLPDYQGVGIGAALFAFDASAWAGLGFRAFSNTAHPAEIHARMRDPRWRCIRPPSMNPGREGSTGRGGALDRNFKRASARLTASFEWRGPPLDRARAEQVMNTYACPVTR
jgi:ABC-type nitrate/sulfonate/bicarbonate transport system ATPase subunit